MESVYHTAPNSIRSYRSDVGLAPKVRIPEVRQESVQEKQNEPGKPPSSWPEVPTRPPPAPPTNSVSRSSSRKSGSTSLCLIPESALVHPTTSCESEKNLRIEERREAKREYRIESESPASREQAVNTPSTGTVITYPKSPPRHFPLVNKVESSNQTSSGTDSSSPPTRTSSPSFSSQSSSSPEHVPKSEQEPGIITGHVKQAVTRFEEIPTLSGAFDEGVKRGRRLGVTEGYKACKAGVSLEDVLVGLVGR